MELDYQTGVLMTSDAAKACTEKNIRAYSETKFNNKCNTAIKKAAHEGKYSAQVAVSREEIPFAQYMTELLMQNGFEDVKYTSDKNWIYFRW